MEKKVNNEILVIDVLRHINNIHVKKFVMDLGISWKSYTEYLRDETHIKMAIYQNMCKYFNKSLAEMEVLKECMRKIKGNDY